MSIIDKTKQTIGFSGVLLLTFIISACSSYRYIESAGDTVHVDKEQLTTSMQKLAQAVERIDAILLVSGVVKNEAKRSIIDELATMEAIADSLGAGQALINHPLLDDNIHQLKADIVTARHAVERDAVNYYWVGRLTGSCTVCHQFPIKK